MLIIDCHAHIVSPDEQRYPPRDNPLRAPGGMDSAEDLRRVSLAHEVSAVRAVHTISFYGYDNRYLGDAARAHPDWLAGVCALDPDDPNSPRLLAQLAGDFGVRTLRSVPGDQRRTFDHAGVRRLWRTAADLGLTVDLFLMSPAWVDGAVKLLGQFPSLTVGFDHCMDLKPGPELADRLEIVRGLARFDNLYAKVDFISTGTRQPYPCADLHEAALGVIDAYGPERCVWSSNFPNALWTPRVTYGEHLRIFAEALPLKAPDREQLLGLTAKRIWFTHLAR